ncbi:MAG: agmatinase [bacterium]
MTDEATYPNFGGVPTRAQGDVSRAEVVFVQAPYEGSVSYGSGTARGPAAILEASRQVETRDEETRVRLEDLSFCLGPVVEPAPAEGPRAYTERVRAAVREVVAADRIPFVLGGEHSVTIGAARAVREKHPRAHLLSLDAHGDLRDSYAGDDHSHACVVRRLLEGGPATIVGIRSYSVDEARFAETAPGLRLVPARALLRDGVRPASLVEDLGEEVYVTVDVDGLDPSVVPATGTPEPGGLGWWDALELLREVFARRRVVGMDVVELAPSPGLHGADFAVARLVAKMLSYRSLGAGAPR